MTTARVGTHTTGMIRQRRTHSELTHHAVKAAVERIVTSGIIQSAAQVARDARTSETFLYRHEKCPCKFCDDVFGCGPVSYYRTRMNSVVDDRDRTAERDARVTLATAQAELANTKAGNQRLRRQIQVLERRLGEVIGVNAQHGIPELQRQSLETDHSAGQLVELSAKVAELQAIIGERDQELDAVRRLNADLTRQLNHPASIRSNQMDPRST